jgi:hypothetical protein
MFAVETLDHITEGSTLHKKHKKTHKKKHKEDVHAAKQNSSDSLSHRHYKDPSMDGKITGHKDSKNTALTVGMKSVHTISHANESSRNAGDFRSKVSLKKYHGDSIKTRPNTPLNTQPHGCIGPTMCATGKAMQNVVTQHDPRAPVHAATHAQFSHGGIAKPAYDTIGMIGAGGTVPKDTPNNASLNSAAGLHYAMNISPNSAFNNMSRQNFMQGMAGQNHGQ